MKVGAYASLGHYADHLAPILAALPTAARGPLWGSRVCHHPDVTPAPRRMRDMDVDYLLVASYVDARRMRPQFWDRLLHVEHGAGQTYGGDPASAGDPSYSGGGDLDGVAMFITTHERHRAGWLARYPDAAVAVVGCPKMDPWHANADPRRGVPVVAVTWHWDCRLLPETRSALPAYASVMRPLAEWAKSLEVVLLGHAHPRIGRQAAQVYERAGIHVAAHLSEVFDRADLLVADNTSAMYEFASLDRPVVVVDSPHYRPEVEHGLRFWSHVPGPRVTDPSHLVGVVADTLAHPDESAALRANATRWVYSATDGRAAERAATAIMELSR